MDVQLAFQNADVLRAIIAHGASTTPAELARITGRDKSNLSKTLGRLADEGIIVREPGSLVVVQAAHQVVAAADIAEGTVAAPPAGFTSLFHAQIQRDPLNPRLDFESPDFIDQLDELRQDILQNGLLQNLVVRPLGDVRDWNVEWNGTALPLYALVSGERRWRAIGQAIADGDWGAEHALPVQIIETDDLGHRLRALAENLQRRDLSPIEEAKAFQGLVEGGMGTDDIADRISVSRRQVQLRLQLLELSARDQERMSLPRDHPDHLSVRDAKKKVQQPKIAPPAAEDLSLVERMILAELLVACANADDQTSYYSTEIGPDHSDGAFGEGLAALVKRGWVYVSGPGYQDGRWKAQVYYSGRDWLDKVYSDFAPPAVGTAGHLRVVARAIRTELHDAMTAAATYDGGGSYATPWLNGPFDLSPEGREIVEARAKEKAEQVAKAETDAVEKANALRTGRLALDTARELEADMAKRTGFAVTDARIGKVLEIANAPLPWRTLTNSTVVDANGKDVITGRSGNGQSHARMVAMVLAVNAAAGFNTPPEEPTADVLRRTDFEKAMADYIALGFDDMDAETAMGHARSALIDYLDRHEINYGAPRHAWTEDGAKAVVDEAPNDSAVNGGGEDEEA